MTMKTASNVAYDLRHIEPQTIVTVHVSPNDVATCDRDSVLILERMNIRDALSAWDEMCDDARLVIRDALANITWDDVEDDRVRDADMRMIVAGMFALGCRMHERIGHEVSLN
jgi:hypothetical protein